MQHEFKTEKRRRKSEFNPPNARATAKLRYFRKGGKRGIHLNFGTASRERTVIKRRQKREGGKGGGTSQKKKDKGGRPKIQSRMRKHVA